MQLLSSLANDESNFLAPVLKANSLTSSSRKVLALAYEVQQDVQKEVVRLQNTILGKTRDKSGKPIKFFSTEARARKVPDSRPRTRMLITH